MGVEGGRPSSSSRGPGGKSQGMRAYRLHHTVARRSRRDGRNTTKMPHPTFLPRESVFLICGGVNVLAGALIFVRPFGDKAELTKRLAQKFDGRIEAAKPDLATLEGAELQLRGKGIILAGVGSLLLCAGASRSKALCTQLAAVVAAGDLALLALVAYYKRAARKEGREFPALEAERAVLPFGVAWGALEAGALLAYLAICVRR
jgi:hypothetical protein